MKKNLHIAPKELTIVLQILNKNLPTDAEVWVFGSRTTNTVKPYSDLDLVIDAHKELSYVTLVNLKHDFEESVLPYKVDIVDWHLLDASFQARVLPYRAIFKLDF